MGRGGEEGCGGGGVEGVVGVARKRRRGWRRRLWRGSGGGGERGEDHQFFSISKETVESWRLVRRDRNISMAVVDRRDGAFSCVLCCGRAQSLLTGSRSEGQDLVIAIRTICGKRSHLMCRASSRVKLR